MSWRRIEGFSQCTFVAILVFVTLSASQGYASILQYGDKDVLGTATDDFQNPAFGQSFSASVNGVSNATLTSKLNSLDQTGPKVQFFSIGIDPDDLETNDILTLSVNQGGTGGDGWAIDFLTIGLTTEVPEPVTICLLSLGGLLLRRRKSTV